MYQQQKPSLLALAAVLAAPLWPAYAQEAREPDLLQEVVIVRGDRFDTPLDQVGRAVSVITAAEIEERQQRFVFDALSAVPGVQVIRSGSFGALASVSIRGLPSAQTLVVQDGIVLNNPSTFANSFNFANFDTSDVAQIEVLRGAQSTLYGSDAIGGVINILTKDGREGAEIDAFVEGGSFGLFRGAVSLLGGTEQVSGRLTVSGVRTRGFSTAEGSNGNVEDDGFENITLSSKARLKANQNLDFEFIGRYQDSEAEFDGFSFPEGPVDGDEIAQNQELALAGNALLTAFGEAFSNRFSVQYLRNDQLNLTDAAASFDALGTRIAIENQARIQPIDQVDLILGAEYDRQNATVAIGFGGNQQIDTISGFGLIQARPLPGVILNAGVRHDASSDFTDETTFSVSAVIEPPVIGGRIRGAFSEGFRAPSAGELSFNSDLFPEFSNGFDIGYERGFFADAATLSVTYFNQDIDDLIAFDLAAFTFVNVQEFSAQGVEVALDVDFGERFSFRGAYAFVDAVNVSTTLAAGNQPDHRLNVELAARPSKRLSLSVGITYNGREFAGGTTLDAFTLLTLRAAYQLTERFELFARIDNATDAEFQDNLGFGTAPISAFGGVRARL